MVFTCNCFVLSLKMKKNASCGIEKEERETHTEGWRV